MLSDADIVGQDDVSRKSEVECHEPDTLVHHRIAVCDVLYLADQLYLQVNVQAFGAGQDIGHKYLFQKQHTLCNSFQLVIDGIVFPIERKPGGLLVGHVLIGGLRYAGKLRVLLVYLHLDRMIPYHEMRLIGREKVPDDFRSLIQTDNGGTVLHALVLNERIGIAQAFLFMVMEQYVLVR